LNQLQLASILEKNKIASTEAFLFLLEIIIPGLASPIRAVYNNENINWNDCLWTAFPFSLGEMTESQNELPSLELKISNVNKVMGGYVEAANGATGASVVIRAVNTGNLNSNIPDVEETFSVQQITTNAFEVTLKLGGDAAATLRRPFWIYTGRHCRNKFKSVRCGYNGAAVSCNKTLSSCKALGNTSRWGAEYGITGKLYAN